MNQHINESEKLVYEICRNSFLSFWSYASPQGKDSKELCDILIVCEPDIIIVSVKEIGISGGDNPTSLKRWRKKAIEASVKQIYGAERWIQEQSNVVRSDGSQGIAFPANQTRRIHRIAVALGGEDKFSIQFGDFGKGFVHVFDKKSLRIIMGALDTIGDFIEYLVEKESLYLSGRKTVFSGGEEELLAFYLHKGRKLTEPTSSYDVLVLNDDLWEGFKNSDEHKAKLDADRCSYVWDRLIELIGDDILSGNLEFGPNLNDSEIALRVMARESRFDRRLLGKSFLEFMNLPDKKKSSRDWL